MDFPYALDIVNSDEWEEGQWKSFFLDRLVKMRAKRAPFDNNWNDYENNQNAVSFYDNNGQLNVNVPLEKTLKEIYMGRTEGKISFDIIPDGQADVEQLQPAKFALNFFLDGNYKDNFWKDNRYLRETKSTYGSGIFYTGIRLYRDFRYKIKEGTNIQSDTDLQNLANFDKVTNETWFFHPKAIHPKDFFIDDAAYGQPDVQYAEDCIFKEKVTASEFKNRYGNNKMFTNTDQITYYQDINPKNKDDNSVDVRQIVLYHYFHRYTKKYMIVANEIHVIYNGLYLYDDGKLPFVNIQHYTNNNRFRGEGIPERIGYLKAYKSEVFQDILNGAQMSSGIHLVVGNDDEIGQDWTVGGRQMNLWRTTGGADKVQQMNTSPNLSYFSTVMQLIDKETTVNSGINPNEQFEATSDKVGIVEIMETNKSIRNRSVDENYNIGLDDTLTMTLARIKQFAPSLLKEVIKGEDGKLLKTIFPKIRVDNYSVERKLGKQIFVENIGKYGYFELKPDVVQGIGVKITTASTNSVLPIIERQKITEYLTNLSTLSNIAQLDMTGETTKKLIAFLRFDELTKRMSDAYGYDINGLAVQSGKDKIAQENIQKLEQLKKLALSLNGTPNVGQNQDQNSMNVGQTNPTPTSGGNPSTNGASMPSQLPPSPSTQGMQG